MDPSDFKSTEMEKLSANANHRSGIDSGLILLGFIFVCTAYLLAKLY